MSQATTPTTAFGLRFVGESGSITGSSAIWLPVPGVSSDDVEKIICYVREMQRANGIFEADVASTAC